MRGDALVVVPTYDEAENITPISEAVRAQGLHLLIVDDGSPDGTGEIADGLADGDTLHVLHRTEKAGLGPAYAAGFDWGLDHGYQILCEMDADFSHDPNDLPRLLAAVDAGADLAIGSRYVPGGGVEDWPFFRRFLSVGGNTYARFVLGTKVHDMTAGYRAFTADAVRRLDPASCRASGYGFQVEMAWKASVLGMTITEVPIIFRDRIRGDSKMDTAIAIEAMRLIAVWGWGRIRGQLPWPAEHR